MKEQKYIINYWLTTVFTLLFFGLASTYGVEGTQWQPYLEWSLDNPSYSGNPFDLIATVTFTHTSSGEQHTTEMFYDGNDVWKFRFAGTRTGTWTFETFSSDPELNGHSSAITINENPAPDVRGFLANVGNKFAIQKDNPSDLKGYIFNVYMNGVQFDSFVGTFGPDMNQVQNKTENYLNNTLENGFEIIFVSVYNSWFKFGVRKHDEHSSKNPDPLTFRVLERIITTVHNAGGRVHIWAWGDEARRWTPIGVGGINGVPDRRLQRYIAARLGPLPGWTLGYGFDLDEWTNPSQLNSWADFMHQHFGWDHFLCSRGFALTGTGNNINAYGGFGREPLATTSGGPADYQEIVEDLDGDLTRPHLYEERHSYLRTGFNLDMDGTRRLLWWESMAGGMGGFFGFYSSSPYPYPNPEQLRTHHTFWHAKNRFLLNMQRANQLSSDGNTRVLKKGSTKYIFYREDAASINMDLSGMAGPQPAIAVDTKADYNEINLGLLGPEQQTWTAPYSSDWAVAIGNQPPIVNAGDDVTTWLVDGERVVQLDGFVSDEDGGPGPATLEWTVIAEPNELNPAEINDPLAPNPTVTVREPGSYTLQLEADDGEFTVTDTMQIVVYADSCEYAQNQEGFERFAGDINHDCKVDFLDLAKLAAEWLEENYSTKQ